jgi:hypothetical protein
LHVEEPAEEEVEVDSFAELSFAANGVEGHEEEGFEEPFGRYAGPAGGAVGSFELGMESIEDAIGAMLDIAKWMIGGDAIFDFESMEEWQLLIGMTAHG